jgi:hypothetical protein
MKLNGMPPGRDVIEPENEARIILGRGRDPKTRGPIGRFDPQRMVTSHPKSRREPVEETDIAVNQRTRPPVDGRFRLDGDSSFVGQELVTQTNAQDGRDTGPSVDDRRRYAGFFRPSRSRRNHHTRESRASRRFVVVRVVSENFDVRSRLDQLVRQDVGERIVVVDQDERRTFHRRSRAS